MSDYMGDIASLYNLGSNTVTAKHATNDSSSYSLDMQDFLQLMVASLQNQSMDSAMDTSEMMNQMVQMSVVQAISDISTLINDTSTLTYAASLVGKEVTIGQYDALGNITERVGTVTGTGTYNGEQVIFVDYHDGKEPESHYLNAIMAIGRLPENEGASTPVESTESAETELSTQEKLLTEIRDLLKEDQGTSGDVVIERTVDDIPDYAKDTDEVSGSEESEAQTEEEREVVIQQTVEDIPEDWLSPEQAGTTSSETVEDVPEETPVETPVEATGEVG